MSITVRGIDNLEGGGESSGDRTQRVVYKSFADAPPAIIDQDQVTAAVVIFTGIDIGSPWVNDLTSYCHKVSSRCVRRVDSVPKRWEWSTTYEFASDPPDKNKEPTKEKDPTKRPPTLSCRVETFDIAAIKDRWGYAVRNSAKDPVVRSKKSSRMVFNWSRYMPKWEWQHSLEAVADKLTYPDLGDPLGVITCVNLPGFMHTRNNSLWVPTGPYSRLLGSMVAGRGEARIDNIRTDISFEFGGCVKVDIEVRLDPFFWWDHFLDQGFFHLVTPGTYTAQNPWFFFVPGTVSPNPYITNAPGQEVRPATPTPLPSTAGSSAPALGRRRFHGEGGWATTPQMLDGAGNPLGENMEPQEMWHQFYYFRDWDVAPLGGPGGYFT